MEKKKLTKVEAVTEIDEKFCVIIFQCASGLVTAECTTTAAHNLQNQFAQHLSIILGQFANSFFYSKSKIMFHKNYSK